MCVGVWSVVKYRGPSLCACFRARVESEVCGAWLRPLVGAAIERDPCKMCVCVLGEGVFDIQDAHETALHLFQRRGI